MVLTYKDGPTSNLKEVYKHVDNEVIYVDVD